MACAQPEAGLAYCAVALGQSEGNIWNGNDGTRWLRREKLSRLYSMPQLIRTFRQGLWCSRRIWAQLDVGLEALFNLEVEAELGLAG